MTSIRESRPTGNGAASSPNDTSKGSHQFTAPWYHDLHEPLTAEDRADIDVLIAAAERGFRLSVACLDCGHALTNPVSMAAHRGPHCRAKAGDGA